MSKRLTKRVMLIGWDAADWHLIHPLIAAGKMPVLEKFLELGVSGKIATLQPILSPILWNSIATGKHADKHGILGFVEPVPGGEGIRGVNSTSRRAKAIWNIISQNEMRSSVVNWFASQPAEPIKGTVITNRFVSLAPEEPGKVPAHPQSVHPPGLREEMDDLRLHPTDLTLQQVMAFFPGKKPDDLTDPRLEALLKLLAECGTTHNAATYLAARDDWDLLAVYYDTIDHAGHLFMEYHPPAMAHVGAADAELYGGVMECVYRYHDMLLGRLLEFVGPETTVILLSDHGFYSDHLRPAVSEHSRDPAAKVGKERNPVAWHRPHGVFAAAGAGVRRDELIHGATLLDVVPTILTLLGLPVADDMDGQPLTRILNEPVTVDRIASYEPPHPDDGVHREVTVEEADPWAARQALLQLAELGYINLPEDGDAAKMVKDAEWDRLSNLAQVYHSTRRYDEAREHLRALLAMEERPHLRSRIALAWIAEGKFDEAEAVIESVSLEEAATPLPRLIRGQILLGRGRFDEAIAILEPLQKEKLPLSHVHTVLGHAYLRRGLVIEAEEAFRQALERDDENAEAHDGLGVILRKKGLYEDAVYEHTRAATLQHHRGITHINLGLALIMSQQYDWAIQAFTVATGIAPQDPFPHRCLSHLYHYAKKDKVRGGQHQSIAMELRRKRREAAKARTIEAAKA